jgi:hypothetical protein
MMLNGFVASWFRAMVLIVAAGTFALSFVTLRPGREKAAARKE